MNIWGNAVQEHYVSKYRKNFELRREKIANLKTKEDAEKMIAAGADRIGTSNANALCE